MPTQNEEYPLKQSDDFLKVLEHTFRQIKPSWEAFLLNITTFVLLFIIPIVTIITLLVAIGGMQLITMSSNGSISLENINAASGVLGVLMVIGGALLILYTTVASIVTEFASVRGEKLSLPQALNRSQPYILPVLGLFLLSTLLIVAGLILFIIPGLYAMFLLVFAAYILIDRNLGVIEAMKESFQFSKQNWKLVLAWLILQAIINIPASIVPVLGNLLTFALSIAYLCLPVIIYLAVQQPVIKKKGTQLKKTP